MEDVYKHRYKKIMLLPLILFIPLLVFTLVYPGIAQGVDLKGGNIIIIRSEKMITEEQLVSVLKANFDLPELKVTTMTSPIGFGAWIQYSKDPKVAEIEAFLNSASSTIDNDAASIVYSNQALKALGEKETTTQNAKTALLEAQTALSTYKEDFAKKLENVISEKLGLGTNAEFQTREVSPTLGAASLQSSFFIAIIGMVLIMVVVFIAFRQLIPSLAIIQAMIFDVLMGMFGMVVLNIPLSLTTLPALLLLIGYSIDTDIMLTSRLLKVKDGLHGKHATDAMITGITMTATTLAALVVMLIISYFYQIDVIYQISAILFFGLIGDLIATWMMNAPILLWFLEKKEAKRSF